MQFFFVARFAAAGEITRGFGLCDVTTQFLLSSLYESGAKREMRIAEVARRWNHELARVMMSALF